MKPFIFDRSRLDETACIIPVGHKDNPGTEAIFQTYHEWLARTTVSRTDIVFWTGRNGRQYFLEACADGGVTGDIFLLDLLTDDQVDEVFKIAGRMADNAARFDYCKQLVATTRGTRL